MSLAPSHRSNRKPRGINTNGHVKSLIMIVNIIKTYIITVKSQRD